MQVSQDMTSVSFTLDNQLVFALLVGFTLVIGVIVYVALSPSTTGKAKDVSASLKYEEQHSQSPPPDHRILHPTTFRSFKLIKSEKLSHNVKFLSFEIPSDRNIGLPVGRHISVRAQIDGTNVTRAYTPVSKPSQLGHFDLVIKKYEFGKLSTYLCDLRVGDMVDVRGPVGRFKYTMNSYRHIGLICGGTGLTPCLQLMRYILEEPDFQEDVTKLTLFFQNRTEEDIILKKELEALQKEHPSRVTVVFFLSNPSSSDWGFRPGEVKGYIHEDSLKSFLQDKSCDFVCLCGPSGFTETFKSMLLTKSGFEEKSIFVF